MDWVRSFINWWLQISKVAHFYLAKCWYHLWSFCQTFSTNVLPVVARLINKGFISSISETARTTIGGMTDSAELISWMVILSNGGIGWDCRFVRLCFGFGCVSELQITDKTMWAGLVMMDGSRAITFTDVLVEQIGLWDVFEVMFKLIDLGCLFVHLV